MNYIINWIIQHLLLSGIVMFAAGSTVITGGDGGQETTTTEGNEEVTEGGEETQTEETEAGQETEEVEPIKETKPEEKQPDWRTVPAEVKAHLQAIAKDNPKLGNLLQNAVYTSQTFLKEFPGGLKEAQGFKKSIEEAGGLEEIKTLRSTHQTLVDEQENLDGQARSGDPAVLDVLMETAGDGFHKLMPVAMDRWAGQDPEGYSHAMGKVMVGAMQENGVVADLNMAFKMLGLNNPEATKIAMEGLKRVAEWANKVNEVAVKPPQKAKIDPEIDRQNKEIEGRRTQLFNDEFGSQFGPWRDSKIRDIVRQVAPKDRKFSDFQMSTLGGRVIEEIKSIITQDPDYVKNLQRLHTARNMPELLKFTKSRTEKLLPDVVKKVYRQLYSDTTLGTKKKVVAKPGEKPVLEQKKAPVVQGWVKVSADKAPKPEEIDNSRSDFNMKFKKQAILKDGRKVYWGDKVPEK